MNEAEKIVPGGAGSVADYLTSDTSVPQYIPFPRFLLDMKLSHTAKLIYSVLLYRANLSKINGWIDEQGRVYITYPVTEIAENLHKGVSVIKEGLSALDRAGLTERKRNFSAPDTIYVKLPTEGLKTDPQTAGKPAISEPENRPTEGLKADPQTAGKPAISEPENQPTDSRKTGYQTAGKPATNKKNKIKDRVIDRDNTQPAAAVSRTPLDIFREFAQEQAPGNRELLESLQDFDEIRKGIAQVNRKKPWTVPAAKGICKKLVQLTDEAGVKNRAGYMCACLDNSVAAGWLSVFPDEHFTDRSPVVRDPVASRDRLHRSLVRKSEPDKPRKITKETNLSDLINCAGIPLPACSTPAAQKEGGKHE